MKELQPTVFHLTHIKAGSRWVTRVLRDCDPAREERKIHLFPDFLRHPINPGKLYLSAYLTKNKFTQLINFPFGINSTTFHHLITRQKPLLLNWWNFQYKKYPIRYFVVIRDLRDTLVSLYFSVKVSHMVKTPLIASQRKLLQTMSVEDGLLYLIAEELLFIAEGQESWIEDDAPIFTYEEILENEYDWFERIVDYCQINISKGNLREIVNRHSFEALTGRKPGEEDIQSHFRKGVVGDWKNYFTPKVKEVFLQRYGQLLIKTGYEKDLNW